jgi:Flp pilus assembly protein TadD
VRRLLKGAVLLAILASAGACLAAMATPEGCRVLRLNGKKAEATGCFEALARSGDAYQMAEGYWGLGDWEQAKKEFEVAIAQPKAPALWKVRYGMLFHERFNNKDAADLFNDALKQDPANAQAYLGLATLSADGFDEKATEYIAKAIALDPRLVEAHELAANLLLEDAKPDEAVKEANTAVALRPDALDAMATLAAADLLADKDADAAAWLDKIAGVNPNYGEGFVIVARHLVLNRRYPEGVAYYRKAVEADPTLWVAHSELGINLMRLGEEDEPRQELELAYNNGQTDSATSNSLKLLDSYKNFVTTKDDTTILRLYKSEADLLRPYFEEQLHKAIVTYSAKYKMKLSGPVQLEVYPNHEDFAVRTMGMPGLGALGVTFGNVVAMDSPSGRVPGEFNWGATMRHELSHVFILSATNYRVPRWFTEGLAVHEEGQADPKWANRLTPDVVAAIKAKKLLPVTQMDQGFIFLEYPEQVLVSYWQAGTILDYIYEHWGEDAILGMVRSFAARKTTPEAIQDNLREGPEQFDKDYAAWLDKRVGATVANLDAWRQQLRALVGTALTGDNDKVIASASAMIKRNPDGEAAGGNNDKVIASASAVINMYPDYVEDANAYEFLASAQLGKGNKQAAADALTEYEKHGGENVGTLKKLASLQIDLGHPKEAAATLDQLNFIYPEDEDLHRKLGGLWLAQGNYAGAVREFNAVIAMKPLDMASAEFDVARAYYAAGDKAKAEDSVLASLEAAPGFKDAQKLLVEIEAGKSGQDSNGVTNQPR